MTTKRGRPPLSAHQRKKKYPPSPRDPLSPVRANRRAFDPTIDKDALRLWRVTKNITNPIWSQEFTARWLGVSLRMYRRWETGMFPVPLYVTNRIHEHEAQLKEIASLKLLLLQNNIAV